MQNLLQRVRAALAERYDIASEAGRGAMAVVYRALDQRHDRTVAVKVLAPQLASAIGRERFLHEIRLAAGLAHPYVLPVLDSGEADGLLYYVMPFVEGRTLRERLEAEGELPIDEAVRITCEMAEALEQAHAAGVLHRDVKPSNILLTERHALLADFGVARAIDETGEERLTGTGVAVGSPAYMSPQQSDPDASPDARDDQYALACVLYEMLTGTPPFTAPSRGALLRRHATDPVPSVRTVRPPVPSELESVLERALAKAATDRFPSIGAFGAAVIDAVNGESRAAGLEARGTGERLVALLPFSGRSAAVTAALGLIVLAIGWVATSGSSPPANSSFAIAPCEASIPRDAELGVEIAQATTLHLLHYEPPLPVDFARMHTWVAENDPIRGPGDRAAARRALRELGAQYFVACTVEDDGDKVQIKLTVFDEDGEPEELRRRVMTRDEGTLRIKLQIAEELLTYDGRTFGGQVAERTDNTDAVEAFLEAERALFDYDLVAADSLYGLARDYDPGFGLAALRHAFVHRWQTVPETEISLDSLFETASRVLPTRDSLLLEAVITDRGPEAMQRFRAVLEAYPDYPNGYLLYADEVYHRGTLAEMGMGPDSARFYLTRALDLNERLGPAREHLIPILIMLGEKEEARKSVDRLCTDFPKARWSVFMAACHVWELGWLERFDPDSARTVRQFLTGPDEAVENLMFAARFARYANLYRAQLALGSALVRRSTSPEEAWHSGVNVVGIALAALGQPGASVQQLARTRRVDERSALLADMWAVVPHALGLEGFSAADAAEAAPRLVAVVADAGADSLLRARAAWALALRAAGDDAADEFERWRGEVERLVPDTTAPDTAHAYRLSQHLGGVANARAGDYERALATTRPLLAYDSIGSTMRPFGRAVLYWQRGEWHRVAGDPDAALAAWMWHWNTDIEGQPTRDVQAAEVDGAFGAWARVRSARLADSLGGRYRETACLEARGVLDRWAPDPALFDPLPVEEPVARLVEEMRAIEDATCRDAT